jgi:hypothetical protein
MKVLRLASILMILTGLAAATSGEIERQLFVRSPYAAANPAFTPPDAIITTVRLGLMLLVAGAVLAFLAGAHRALPFRYVALWGLLMAYCAYLGANSLSMGELLTVTGYSTFAPGFAVASILLFAGADPRFWHPLVRVIAPATIAVACIAGVQLLHISSATRTEAYARLFTCASILEVGALLPLGMWASARLPLRLLSWVPFLTLVLVTVAMQARLMVIEVITLFVLFSFLTRRQSAKRGLRWMAPAVILIAVTVGVVAIGSYSESTIIESARAFWERRYEDTRTGQAISFFDKVLVEELMVGKGIPRLGDYSGQGERGIDCGYINLMFIAGIPGLLLFLALHVLPAARCVRMQLTPLDAACVAAVLTYAVRLFSSTVPNLEPNYFVLLLVMGRCAAISVSRQPRWFPVRHAQRTFLPRNARAACLRESR